MAWLGGCCVARQGLVLRIWQVEAEPARSRCEEEDELMGMIICTHLDRLMAESVADGYWMALMK